MPDDQPRKLFFHGSTQGIECAVDLVNKLLQSAPNLINRHGAAKKLHSNIVDCPADLVGLLIGKKGWTIKKIQLESGAQISINQSVREGHPRKIIVSGMQGSVELATRLIEEVLRNKPEEDNEFNDLMLLNSMSLNGRAEPVLMTHLPASSGGMYTANGSLAADYSSSSSSAGFSESPSKMSPMMWENEEQLRQATLVRGNEALYLQQSNASNSFQPPHPSRFNSIRQVATSSVASEIARRPSLSYPMKDFGISDYPLPSSSIDAIFDSRRNNLHHGDKDFEESETVEGDSSFRGHDDMSMYSQQPMRRLSTGSISPGHIYGLGMGFNPARGSDVPAAPMTSMYARQTESFASEADNTIARQLQLKALQRQRTLQLQYEHKEKQLASLASLRSLDPDRAAYFKQLLPMQPQPQMQYRGGHQQQQQQYSKLPPRPSSATAAMSSINGASEVSGGEFGWLGNGTTSLPSSSSSSPFSGIPPGLPRRNVSPPSPSFSLHQQHQQPQPPHSSRAPMSRSYLDESFFSSP